VISERVFQLEGFFCVGKCFQIWKQKKWILACFVNLVNNCLHISASWSSKSSPIAKRWEGHSGREWRVGPHQNMRTSQEIFPASIMCKQHLLIFQSNGIRCPHSPHACMQWAMASGTWICYLHVNLGNFLCVISGLKWGKCPYLGQ